MMIAVKLIQPAWKKHTIICTSLSRIMDAKEKHYHLPPYISTLVTLCSHISVTLWALYGMLFLTENRVTTPPDKVPSFLNARYDQCYY